MRWPLRCSSAAIIGVIWCLAAPAHADPRSDIAAKTRAAMASYDALDYDAARRLLNQAIAIAKRAKLDRDPLVARVYLDLGIAQLASSDQEAAKVAFLSAAQIDPKITVDPAYKSAELVRMLDDAKAAAGDPGDPGDECRTVRGIQPAPIAGARRGVAQPIEVVIGGDVSPARVVALYRPEGAIDFTEVRLVRQSGCRYAGAIPAAAMHGALVHYYIAAYDASNRVLAAKGSSGAPSALELGGAGAPARDPAETAAAPLPEAPRAQAPGVVERAAPAARRAKLVLSVSAGTGFGYVSGKTEGDNIVQQCCIGSSPVVISPELRYNLGPRLSVGAVARFGLPLGANVMGHSTLAPAGFVRLGYAFSDSGRGLHAMAELGFGILRNTIKLSADMPGMDTDVVAQGPLLLGAGVGYTFRISDSLAILVDLDAIAGLAVVDKLGTAVHLNTGIGGDLRAGVAVGF
ncbi:MAG TPA: tetratricopeptide repeat protein [Kofleriaceae bacterium]|nr:tetratricopeptide repeat protein [Kofleriaceae bacterium]